MPEPMDPPASASNDDPTPRPEPPAAVAFFQPRRRLLPLSAVLLVGAALLAGGLGLGLLAPLLPGVALLVIGVRGYVDVLRGFTQLDRHGIVAVRWRWHRIGWQQVSRISIVCLGARRHLRVVTTAGAVRRLAAPRSTTFAVDPRFDQHASQVLAQWRRHRPDARFHRARLPRAILAAAWILLGVLPAAGLVGIEHPWLRAWWPGVRAATALPDACHAVSANVVRPVTGRTRPRPEPRQDEQHHGCTWGAWRTGTLSVEYRLAESSPVSGADKLRHAMRSYAAHPSARPVAGLGDRCLTATKRTWDLQWKATVRARHANVMVFVTVVARRPAADLTSTALWVARQALSRIELS